jgi:hypothetical protein
MVFIVIHNILDSTNDKREAHVSSSIHPLYYYAPENSVQNNFLLELAGFAFCLRPAAMTFGQKSFMTKKFF